MAYSGFISDPEYTRKSQNEVIAGEWAFQNTITFAKTIRGTAIATYYADLAEYYEHDYSELIPQGTIVKFGGKKEITKTKPHDRKIFGVVSTKPGVILNKKDGDNFVPVALSGKVPCRVTGKVKKFDTLTTSGVHGVAKKMTLLDKLLFRPKLGIALENKQENTESLIEIFVQSHI